MDVELAPVSATSMGFHPSLSDSLDAIMEAAVADSAAPGMSLAVGRYGRLVHFRGYGRIDWAEDAPDVTVRTLYDLASLTKVVATTTAAMILEEEGRLDLNAPVCEYLRGFDAPDKAFITPYMLLAHVSGMTTRMLYREAQGREEYLKAINEYPLQSAPGTEMSYSDWNMIIMQLVIEQITGTTLDAFLQERVWEPLTMRDTGFLPDPALLARTAPTEIQEWRGGMVHGVVHDENAWGLGGVAGHAGLFSSARDLAVFVQMLLNGGSYGDVQILQPETVARWTSRQTLGSSRALGWDTPSGRSSAGDHFSAWSFGHTGFTGTSLWMDPRQNLFVVLLSNHVNPTRGSSKIFTVRRQVADAVQEAVLAPAYGK
jgi:CubicO group peptidase (beta-lactamase class C family)